MQKSYDVFADDGSKPIDEKTTKFSEHLLEARLDSERVQLENKIAKEHADKK